MNNVVWCKHGTLPIPETGSAWVYRGNVSSVLIGKTVYRSLLPFEDSEEFANECFEVWKKAGRGGTPSSPAALAALAFQTVRGGQSANNLLRGLMHGGLCQSLATGAVRIPAYHYDMRAAYLWSASKHYPSRVFPFRAGSKHWAGAWLCERLPDGDFPVWFTPGRAFFYTSEDHTVFNLPGRLLYGVSWEAYDVDVYGPLLAFADRVGERIWRHVRKGFWGRWGAQDRCIRRIYRAGRVVGEIPVPGFGQNTLWAALTIQRVGLKMFNFVDPCALSLHCDAILTTRELPESLGIGGLRLEERFPGGVFIRSISQWLPLGGSRNETRVARFTPQRPALASI